MHRTKPGVTNTGIPLPNGVARYRMRTRSGAMMNFPDYVPVAVQKFFTAEVDRWAPLVVAVEHRLARVECLIKEWSNLCECCQVENSLEDLPRRRCSTAKARAYYVSKIDYIRRLAGLIPDDERIKEAYVALRREFTSDGQWLRFMDAAYSSMDDYVDYRARKNRAIKQREKVARAADMFVGALNQLRATGVVLPPELRERSITAAVPTSDLELKLLYQRIALAVGASKHPDLVMLLRNAASTARVAPLSFYATEVEAAISKQKRNLKTEYLRAFGHLLTNGTVTIAALTKGEPILLTPCVRRAMAVTATVAINRDVIVTEDDVRKALDVPEDSRTKKPRNPPSPRNIQGQ